MSYLKKFFKSIYSIVKEIGKFIGIIVNFILLTILYIIGVGLTSIIAKIFRKKFLLLKKPETESYWLDNKITKKKLTDYHRSF